MGKNDLYELIDLGENPHPDVCVLSISFFIDVVCNQAKDIRDLMKYVNVGNKDCVDALQDLSIALSTGMGQHYHFSWSTVDCGYVVICGSAYKVFDQGGLFGAMLGEDVLGKVADLIDGKNADELNVWSFFVSYPPSLSV